ncbi:MAG: GTPase Era [Chloroflexota bacterium]
MTELPIDWLDEDLPEDHRSGVVAIIGRPNVGKSTLINRILGQKIAIVTDKPQTTRNRQLGIYTEVRGQILFMDTPGLHKPFNKLSEFMINAAEFAVKDADAILWVMDISEPPQESESYIAETLKRLSAGDTPIVLALNKRDLVAEEADLSEHTALIDHTRAVPLSAASGDGVQDLLDGLIDLLPEGPRYYPPEQVSEVNMRFIAAELVREAIINRTEQEIPYSVAVTIDEYKERSEDMTYIAATIHVERESQKGIIVGKGGAMIKAIGTDARAELQRVTGTRVYLELHVKVLKDWRQNERFLQRVGYRMPRKND